MSELALNLPTTKEIAVIGKAITALDVFNTSAGVEPLLAEIRAEVAKHSPDLTTKKGRDAIASLAYKVAQSKTALDDLGKELTIEQKRAIAKVDAERKTLRDECDRIRDEVRRPLVEWEEAEKMRVEGHEAAIREAQAIQSMARIQQTQTWLDVATDELADLGVRNWDEFADRGMEAVTLARMAVEERSKELVIEEAERKKVEAERAELAELRRKQQERDEADRIAREAEEAKAFAAEIERKRQEAEREAEAERQRIAEQAAERERERLAAEARQREEEHARELEAAEQRRLDEIARMQAEREAAIQAERERVIMEQQAADEAASKREANKRHSAKINNEAAAAIADILTNGTIHAETTDLDAAKTIVRAIAKGEIPHVTIAY